MKRNIFYKLLSFLCLLFLVANLAACGTKPKSNLPTKTPPAKNPSAKQLTIATTTSVNDSGLLTKLKPIFEKKYNTKLKILSLGTGQALETARRGNAQATLTHDKPSEEKFIKEGYGLKRNIVMANYFILVGPAQDPAKIKGEKPLEALRKIANSQSPFIARSDKSGTAMKNQELWEKAELKAAGHWYTQTGTGQAAALTLANDKKAYTLTDKPTFLVLKRKGKLPNLVSLVDTKDSNLLNVYSVMLVNPQKVRNTNNALARNFSDFLLSAEAQKVIGEYGQKEFGQKLFIPRRQMTREQLK